MGEGLGGCGFGGSHAGCESDVAVGAECFFYFVCKSFHHESVEKNALQDVLQGYVRPDAKAGGDVSRGGVGVGFLSLTIVREKETFEIDLNICKKEFKLGVYTLFHLLLLMSKLFLFRVSISFQAPNLPVMNVNEIKSKQQQQ